jgi:hypothetical protein
MENKQLGIVLLVIGVIILLLSLLANSIGIGGAPGFGYKQITGTVIGAILAIVGYVLFSRR